MNTKELKIKAVQNAYQCQGQNFYVTEEGIKRDFNLLGGKYEFKIYNNRKAVIIEDGKGKVIEEITISSELRDTTNAPVGKTSKQKGHTLPTD